MPKGFNCPPIAVPPLHPCMHSSPEGGGFGGAGRDDTVRGETIPRPVFLALSSLVRGAFPLMPVRRCALRAGAWHEHCPLLPVPLPERGPACPAPQEFDKKYNPTWHCIVGRNFGSCASALRVLPCKPQMSSTGACLLRRAQPPAPCRAVSAPAAPCSRPSPAAFSHRYVTHETKHFIYFYLGQVAILLFKSG